jgi:methionyl-tRNA formyltransferase
VSDPNDEAVRRCLRCIRPDLVIARCKVLLRPDIFEIARAGTYALHPGICPEYRNAHGCFWALARRDIGRVGMTLLRIDRGVDTGPAFLRASCAYDELHESHIVIQHRVVTENLDAIAGVLTRLAQGRAEPLESAARESAVWGQPTLSAYRAWKAGAKRDRNHAAHLTAVP